MKTSTRLIRNVGSLAFLGVAAVVTAEPLLAENPQPVIESVSREPDAGQLFRLNGAGFGERELWFGGAPIKLEGKYITVVGWGEDRIYAYPPKELKAGRYKLFVRNQRVRSNEIDVVVRPVIDEVKHTSEQGRDVILLKGGGFGSEAEGSEVSFAGQPLTPLRWGPLEIAVPLPAKASSSNPVFAVTVSGLRAEKESSFPPLPGKTVVKAGMRETHLIITGKYFGAEVVDGALLVDGHEAPILTWEDDKIEAAIPNDLPVGSYPMSLRARGYIVSPANLEIIPLVRALSYADGRAGDTLELLGAHFPSDKENVHVSIAEKEAEVLESSPQRILIRIPQGAVEGKQMIRVSVAQGKQTSPAVPFRVLPPKAGVVTFEKFGDAQEGFQ